MKRGVHLAVWLLAALGTSALSAQLLVPDIPYEAADILKFPDGVYLGEAAGVATNSKGHIFAYTRTGSTNVTLGTNRIFVRNAARLFEFDETGQYVREIGQGVYGFVFAQAVRVDAQDNIWVVDRGSNMVIKFDPEGHILMTLGRKPEAIPIQVAGPAAAPGPPGAAPAGGAAAAPVGAGVPGDNFSRPTGVAFDTAGNIFVADGWGGNNARVAKFDRNGTFLKSWGSRGTGPGQFGGLHDIAVDARGNVYVADRANRRVQVFDNDGAFKTQFVNVGAPWAVCITPGPQQSLYVSNSNDTDSLDDGEIYKLDLDGRIAGKFGRAGKLPNEFGSVNQIDCRKENELYVGEIGNWRVQRVALRPSGQTAR